LREEASHSIHSSDSAPFGDRVFDSDPLEARLKADGIVLIAPHRSNRPNPKTQDGHSLRRYKRHWKVERLWA